MTFFFKQITALIRLYHHLKFVNLFHVNKSLLNRTVGKHTLGNRSCWSSILCMWSWSTEWRRRNSSRGHNYRISATYYSRQIPPEHRNLPRSAPPQISSIGNTKSFPLKQLFCTVPRVRSFIHKFTGRFLRPVRYHLHQVFKTIVPLSTFHPQYHNLCSS